MKRGLFLDAESYADCDERAREALAKSFGIRRFGSSHELTGQGERPSEADFLISGWACKYKMLPDGRRQLIALLLPGNAWNFENYCHGETDFAVATLSPVTMARIPYWRMRHLLREHERIRLLTRGLHYELASVQQNLVVSLGTRDGLQRVAHLLVEVYRRLEEVGLAADGRCAFPITQNDVGDLLGITAVHANRLIQDLKARKLIRLQSRTLDILDSAGLEAIAGPFARSGDTALRRRRAVKSTSVSAANRQQGRLSAAG